jgi:dihydrofolate reductase
MRTIYMTTATLDGYLADEQHSLDWLFEVPRESDGRSDVGAFVDGIGAIAMGATTYAWMLDNLGVLENPAEWRSWYGATPTWVFTHRELPAVPGIPITFVQGDVRSVHPELVKAAAPQDVWLMGGGELVGRFLDAGLLDELQVSIQPVVLGRGVPILPRRLESDRLRLLSAERDGQIVTVRYAVS